MAQTDTANSPETAPVKPGACPPGDRAISVASGSERACDDFGSPAVARRIKTTSASARSLPVAAPTTRACGPGSEPPFFSVVIPVRDEIDRLERCLAALNNQSLDTTRFEVIVVADGSADWTDEIAVRHGARAVHQQRKGAAAARNRGIDEARGEIILFTDADCVPAERWAERLSAPLRDPAVAGAVGRIVSRQTHWVAALIQMELEERYSRMGHQECIDFLNTGNCAFRRDLLRQNRFDESFAFLEDVELSFRLAEGGARMILVQDALVEHPHPESLFAYMRRKFRYASFAPSIYRRFPGKTFSDSRTPLNRRLQLLLLALGLLMLAGTALSSWASMAGTLCLAASVLFSFPVCRRAFAHSAKLGIAAPVFVLMGNVAFVAGTLWGASRAPIRAATQPSRDQSGADL